MLLLEIKELIHEILKRRVSTVNKYNQRKELFHYYSQWQMKDRTVSFYTIAEAVILIQDSVKCGEIIHQETLPVLSAQQFNHITSIYPHTACTHNMNEAFRNKKKTLFFIMANLTETFETQKVSKNMNDMTASPLTNNRIYYLSLNSVKTDSYDW